MSPHKRYKKAFEANKPSLPVGYFDDIFIPVHTAENDKTDYYTPSAVHPIYHDTAPYDPSRENQADYTVNIEISAHGTPCCEHNKSEYKEAYITLTDDNFRHIELCEEHLHSLYLCLCRVLENPYESCEEVGGVGIKLELPDKPYLYKYTGGGRKYNIYFTGGKKQLSLTVNEAKLVDLAERLSRHPLFNALFAGESEELKKHCVSAELRLSFIDKRRRVHKRMNPLYRGKAVNLGMSQKRAKSKPLTDFNAWLTYDFECIICHCEKSYMPAAVIEAGRKNDRLCFALCMDCVYDLQYVLRNVNKNRLTYSDCDGLTVVYTDKFNEGQFCYFCGEDQGHCYHVTLNTLRIQLCSHCRKTVVAQLQELLEKMEKMNPKIIKNTAD